MPQDFTGKVVAISGAASGIGFATAKYLYSLGATLSITDVRKEALEAAIPQITSSSPSSSVANPTQASKDAQALQTTRELQEKSSSGNVIETSGAIQTSDERILAVTTDVRSSAQVDSWISQTVSKFGRLDCSANLAGVVGRHIGTSPLTALTDADWAFVLDINLTGVFYALRAQLRAMEGQGGPGSIVNIASTAGIQGNARNADYSASKHGVVGLTRSAAKEVGGSGVRVNCIAPGLIDTPMVQTLPKEMAEGTQRLLESGQALHRPGKPEEVAKLIAFLLSEESAFSTGAVYVVDGGQVC